MPRYDPGVFAVSSVDEAKAIILTESVAGTTEQRWEQETPVVAELLMRELQIGAEHLVLDYGCGIGRVAKPLIQQRGCAVVGADISGSMLQLAPGYVALVRFAAMHPKMIDALVAQGLRFDSAYAIWVIQHCANPQEDLTRIASALKDGGRFVLINTQHRCVPTDQGWVNDGIDLQPILRTLFKDVKMSSVPQEIAPESRPELYYCAVCVR